MMMRLLFWLWSFWFVGLAIIFVPAVVVHAAEKVPAWATGGISGAHENFTNESRIPASYDRDALKTLLFPNALVVHEKTVEVPWLIFVKPWQASPGLSVAVLETVTYEKSSFGAGAAHQATTLYIALIAGGTLGEKIDLRAQGQITSVAERHLRNLDLAPYRLAPDKLAFGVRTKMNWPLSGGSAYNEYLMLFLPDGKKLITVLNTLMKSWRMGNDGTFADGSSNKAEEGDETSAVITMLGTLTQGFYDLRKSLPRKRALVYRWDQNRYVAKGQDPVANVNDFPGAEVE